MNSPHPFPFQNHKRILLKISGEFLRQKNQEAFCWHTMDTLAQSIQSLSSHQWVIVIGGGNIWRGRQAPLHFCKRSADTMGMMATHINALSLQEIFSQKNVDSSILTARFVEGVGKTFSVQKAEKELEKNRVLICSGGTGVGGITTDTAAILRAYETNCSLMMKGTKVNGIYDCDPAKNPGAKFLPCISYNDAISCKIGVIDPSALVLAQQHKKIVVIL